MRTPPSTALAALLITLAACGTEPSASDAIVARDSSGVAIVENDLLRLNATCTVDPAPSLSIGVEEGGEEYELDRVFGAARLSDGRIVLVNGSTMQIRYYDSTGTYLRSAGRQGDGPGEFHDPFYLQVMAGDTVYVGDYDPWRFVVFGPDGEWVRTLTASPLLVNSPEHWGLLRDGRMMLAVSDVASKAPLPTGQFGTEKVTVQFHDALGALVDTLGTFANVRRGEIVAGSRMFTTPMFESYFHAEARDEAIILAHGSERELRIHGTGDGLPLQRIVRWTGESREVRSADVDAERERERKSLAGYPPSAMLDVMLETSTSSERPIADVLPAMNLVKIGTDGRIWVREYSLPADTTARRWLAFTPDGRLDCRARIPRMGEHLEFGPDYLLVKHEDSLRVERVRRHRMTRPGDAR